ncbi:MAG: hypothetical protein QME45_05540 [Clostridiales bacterium]|nr:hypothetical protein [Clostridiales bacterium]
MMKFDKNGIYYYGTNREFIMSLKKVSFVDITIKELLRAKCKTGLRQRPEIDISYGRI